MSKFFTKIILLLLFTTLAYSHSQQLQFEHITTKDGLSNNNVKCILQDRQGFMWFGTEEGVSRFDGYNFVRYKHIPDDVNSISANYIWSMFEDSEGFIWIGTGNGLNKFDPVTEKFSHYFHDEQRPESISDNDVTCILEDSDGYLWIGTSHGLNQFNRKTQKFKHFIHEPHNPNSISLNYISCLYEDSRGDLWIGTGSIAAETSGGINKFDQKTETFVSYKFEPSRYGHSNWITAIAEDASANLWIGTDYGLREFNRNTNTFTHYYYHDSSPLSLARNTIQSVLIDSKDNVWVGSWGGGLNLLNKISGEFIQYHNNPQDTYSLNNNKVKTIYEDRNGCLWIGTTGGGINTIKPLSNFFQHYGKYISEVRMQTGYEVNSYKFIYEDRSGKLWLGSEGEINVLDRSVLANNWTTIQLGHLGTSVNSIIEDESGIFWIGSTHGLIRYDPLKKQEKWYTFTESESPGLITFPVYNVLIDQEGLLWIGTQQGLYRFDRQNNTYTRFVHEPELMNTLSDNRVFSILKDSFGTLWIGTVYGLNKFDPRNQVFLNYQVDQKILDHLRYNDIRVMCEDKLNNLWLGTAYGLKMFSLTTGNFRLFTQKDGLPDNVINGLLADENNNIWISTNSGLSKFNHETNQFKNYDYWDGIQNTTFNSGACLKNKNGEMFFGGNNGLTGFHPDSIKQDSSVPPIVITSFKKYNEPVLLDTSISYTKKLILAYHENVISFEFAALNFINPRKNQFAYKMEGFIDDWIYSGNKHDVTFTNLSPGNYLFRVKGSNSADVWNEQGASLRIIVLPPWWRTGWAYAFYALIMGSLVIGLWRFQVRRIQIRNELKMRRFESQKLQELDSLKSRFFANISHEFRTPLTLILGPLGKLLSQTKSKEKKQELKLMQRNAQRLQRLINQLLDLSKIEAGKMTLQAQPENIVALLNRIVQSFESQAKLKGIELKFQSEPDEIIAYIDRDKIENIFYNLLSNALKFTPSSGTVACRIQIAEYGKKINGKFRIPQSEIRISVSDTGIGIPPDHLDKIFDRFYQIDDSYTREHEGSGIGLALTKELVDLHHGKIEVESELNKGTTFSVYLPLGKDHLKPEEIAAQLSESDDPSESLKFTPEEERSESSELSERFVLLSRRKALPIVLIVEDNRDMRSYLKDCLTSDYRIIETVDGEDGLKTAIDKIPDLIISDVMMPKMDGFQLCRRLKIDERTSHIPVILLTARAAAADKIGGLEFGADDYIIKPFDTKELLVRVKNLIDQRRLLRKKFSQQTAFMPDEIATTPVDVSFLQKAKHIVEGHLADEDFSVESLAKNIGMSRSQLHRKLRALTDRSASEFIRTLRLQRAAHLLQQKQFSVTEVAFEVGFNNPSYFAACFRKQFGKLPSEYITKT